MADLVLVKTGGMLYGADDYSKAYVRKQPIGSRLTLNVVNKKQKRRDILNRLSHAIYHEAAKMKGDCEPDDEKAEMKYRFGVPVLIHDPVGGEIYKDFYRRMLDGLTYEQRVDRMRASSKIQVPVTSQMTDPQISKYLDRILRFYAEQGFVILTPKQKQFIQYPEAQQ